MSASRLPSVLLSRERGDMLLLSNSSSSCTGVTRTADFPRKLLLLLFLLLLLLL